MSNKKSASTNDSIDNPIQILKKGTCPTSSGKSNLGYEVGTDESGDIHLRVSSNDGGGFFSNEWVAYNDIQVALKARPTDQGVTSATFHKIFRGKSANTPGFLIAVLCAEGIIEPMGDKKRVHQACDPSAFLASIAALQKGTGTTSGKKPAAKAKPEAKAKAASAAKATTPPKSAAKTSRKLASKNPKNP